MHASWSSESDPGPEPAGDIPVPFRVEVEPERDVVRVCPIGELDLGTVEEVRAQLVELRSSGFSRLILDLRRTTFLDSTGLRLAIDENAASANDGYSFVIFAGPPAVQHAFEVSGLASQLPFVDPQAAGSDPARRTSGVKDA